MYCVLCTVYCVLCTVYCVLCTVYCVLCTVYCVLCTVYCVLCTVYCVLCTVYCVLCTVYCVLCTVYCVLCTVYCVLCTVYCVLCTVYCVLCTVYCVPYDPFVEWEGVSGFASIMSHTTTQPPSPKKTPQSAIFCYFLRFSAIFCYFGVVSHTKNYKLLGEIEDFSPWGVPTPSDSYFPRLRLGKYTSLGVAPPSGKKSFNFSLEYITNFFCFSFKLIWLE